MRNTSTHPGQTRMIFKHRNRRKYVRKTHIRKNASELKKTHSTLRGTEAHTQAKIEETDTHALMKYN